MKIKKTLINKIKNNDRILYKSLVPLIIRAENNMMTHEEISGVISGFAYVKLALVNDLPDVSELFAIAQQRMEYELYKRIKAQKE